MSEEWTIQLCESAFSRKKPFGGLYHRLNGVVAGHSFVRLSDPDGRPVQEVHGGALHADDDSDDKPEWNQLLVLADMVLPERFSQYRLFAWLHEGIECHSPEKVAGMSVTLSDDEKEIKRRWVNGLEFAARANTEDRRYHFLDSNCNTLARKIFSAMGVGIHSTITGTFGLNGRLRGPEVDTFGTYFNMHAGETLYRIELRRQELTEEIEAGVRPRHRAGTINPANLALK